MIARSPGSLFRFLPHRQDEMHVTMGLVGLDRPGRSLQITPRNQYTHHASPGNVQIGCECLRCSTCHVRKYPSEDCETHKPTHAPARLSMSVNRQKHSTSIRSIGYVALRLGVGLPCASCGKAIRRKPQPLDVALPRLSIKKIRTNGLASTESLPRRCRVRRRGEVRRQD